MLIMLNSSPICDVSHAYRYYITAQGHQPYESKPKEWRREEAVCRRVYRTIFL